MEVIYYIKGEINLFFGVLPSRARKYCKVTNKSISGSKLTNKITLKNHLMQKPTMGIDANRNKVYFRIGNARN